MKRPIGIFQCEWTLPDNAPHPGSALLVGDALLSGYDVTRALVQIGALDEFVQLIQDRSKWEEEIAQANSAVEDLVVIMGQKHTELAKT